MVRINVMNMALKQQKNISAALPENGSPDSAVSLNGVSKTVSSGFIPKKKEILKDISFTVKRGEIFGFLGHNGAGKTTTLKSIVGLCRPTSGNINLFGKKNCSANRKRMGFLPESPNFYKHLTGFEFLKFNASLFDISGNDCMQQVDHLLSLVGLEDKKNIYLKNYSKGMLQRIGIAQSLINSPDLLILDEPMSGMDPVGRKDIRDIIINLKSEGKTVLFSTHILSDVEMICDSIAIIIRGEIRHTGKLQDIIDPGFSSVEITFRNNTTDFLKKFNNFKIIGKSGNETTILPDGEAAKDMLIRAICNSGGSIIAVTPKRQLLEKLFIDQLHAKGPQAIS